MTFVSGMPTERATALAVVALSPEIIHVPRPCACKRARTSLASGRTGSETANAAATVKPSNSSPAAPAAAGETAMRTTLLPSDFHDWRRAESRPSTAARCSSIHASFPITTTHFGASNDALSPRPGVSSTDDALNELARFSTQYPRMALANGCELAASTSIARPRMSSPDSRWDAPPAAAMTTTSAFVTLGSPPSVRVPVLSKTMASSCAASWRASPPPRARMPNLAASPEPTRSAVGAARPIPQGHATTNTAIANSRDQTAVCYVHACVRQ